MPDRKIIHIDMDAFYASVEQRDNPALRGKPVAVGGSGMRGVVASASYEARRYGVRSAMPSVVAQRLCPELIFAKSRFEVYKEVSRQIRDIFHEYADLVEPLSLDEAYLDVTTDKMGIGSATLVAKAILKRIVETTHLTASAGVSFNKFLAKVASGVNKPNGIKVITPEEADHFLGQLPIEKFHGIGAATTKKMKALGIHTGADLRQWPEADLAQYFGKAGQHYYRIVRADDRREVNPNRIRKSIGAERTFFEDLSDLDAMKEKLANIAGIVHEYMLKHDNFGRTVTLKIKSSDFRQITRSKTFSSELHDLDALIATVYELLEQNRQEVEKVRLLGVTVSNLARERSTEGVQLSFEF
ncbi:MAG: DNA polymerase IV [Saprospiraceae bacterium]|nr:DNA polymerase IV [Saprospiraceae bacterium]MDZ4702969.1 DNA polymerase IV [Saprospiraceae bacterium]